ncbi:MAG: hypothetical protein GVY15_01310 [Bacteroidetes bacterium]|jgi:regulator of replication initiation timing|nr:hypothetical protein [Bacteroidota bacterium]
MAPPSSPSDPVDDLEAQEAAIELAFDDAVRHKSRRALEQLRDRVADALDEIKRLRQENARLADRLRALQEAAGIDDPNRTVLSIDEHPEAARRKVEQFVRALDQYISQAEKQS